MMGLGDLKELSRIGGGRKKRYSREENRVIFF